MIYDITHSVGGLFNHQYSKNKSQKARFRSFIREMTHMRVGLSLSLQHMNRSFEVCKYFSLNPSTYESVMPWFQTMGWLRLVGSLK